MQRDRKKPKFLKELPGLRKGRELIKKAKTLTVLQAVWASETRQHLR